MRIENCTDNALAPLFGSRVLGRASAASAWLAVRAMVLS